MRRIALLVEYEGTAYHGSQWQTRLDTIEGRVREAVARLTGERAKVRSQGRTDAGVHAFGQMMSIDTSTEHRPEVFVGGLNRFLPQDIAVKAACELPAAFDIRRRARSRTYRYFLAEDRTPSPLRRRWAWVVDRPLDLESMREAAASLVGEHDFAAFASEPDQPTNTMRRMLRATVERKGRSLEFVFEATAFLPHQVRRMVGSLVEVGRGRMTVEAFRGFLDSPLFASAGPVAPPQGLYLWQVCYEPPLFEGQL